MGWFLPDGSSQEETAAFVAAQVWEPFEGLWGFAGRTRALKEAARAGQRVSTAPGMRASAVSRGVRVPALVRPAPTPLFRPAGGGADRAGRLGSNAENRVGLPTS